MHDGLRGSHWLLVLLLLTIALIPVVAALR